jgi:hypothetical protein
MRPTIHPYLCLEFTHQKTGVCFNERYYSDDVTRRESDVRINSTLQAWAAAHWPSQAGCWSADPPYAVGVGAAYVIIAALFGAGIRYYDNFHPDAGSEPLASVTEPEQIHVPDPRTTWPLSDYVERYHRLVSRYGKEQVTLPGFEYGSAMEPSRRGLIMHSPLTTAYKLRGSQLFVDMVERPDIAHRLFVAVRDTYYRVCDLMIDLLGLKTDHIFFGACASSWVSPGLWREWELPAITEIVNRYGAATVLHSCGNSTHVLPAFAGLPRLRELHLGDKTDLAVARSTFPDVGFFIVPDSVAWARDPAEKTIRSIQAMSAAASSGPLAFQFVLEAGIPDASVEAIVKSVEG